MLLLFVKSVKLLILYIAEKSTSRHSLPLFGYSAKFAKYIEKDLQFRFCHTCISEIKNVINKINLFMFVIGRKKRYLQKC